MTTRSICISAAVLLLAMMLTWPAFPDQSNTKPVGSQSSGAGAGKINFNPFSVPRKIGKSSPVFHSIEQKGDSSRGKFIRQATSSRV
ncbi:MAG: hypothetical protein WBQ54_15775, partial [Pseudolabrys sp.]